MIEPKFGRGVYVSAFAHISGDVEIGNDCSFWPGASVRCDRESDDTETIRIGDRVNIQDCASVHIARGGHSVRIGNDTSIGHGAIVHGCTVGKGCLIGMSATVMTGAVIGDGSLIAAGCLVSEGKIIPPGSLVMGVPGRVVGPLTPEQKQYIAATSEDYREMARMQLPHPIKDGI